MKEDKMRKDFEAAAPSIGISYLGLNGGIGGVDRTYWGNDAEVGWLAWQAAARTAVPAWQPIETAPKDGTVVLARIPDQDVQQAVMWSAKDGCWVIQWDHWKLKGFDTPTHWVPLPEVE